MVKIRVSLGLATLPFQKRTFAFSKLVKKTFSCRSWIPMLMHNIFLHKNDKTLYIFFAQGICSLFFMKFCMPAIIYDLCIIFFSIILKCKAFFLYKFSIWSHTFNYSLSLYCFCCLMPKGTQGCCSSLGHGYLIGERGCQAGPDNCSKY